MIWHLALAVIACLAQVGCGGSQQPEPSGQVSTISNSSTSTVNTTVVSTTVVSNPAQTGTTSSTATTYSVAKLSSDPVGGYAGVAYSAEMKVKVTDASGAPAPGKTIAWLVNDDGWTIPSSSITDSSGNASTYWLPGSSASPELTATLTSSSAGPTVPKATFKGSTQAWGKKLDHIAITYYESVPSTSGVFRDVTPITDPRGTFYAVVGWDNGYAGIQRGGYYFNGQVQFSLWDNSGVSASIVNSGNSICEGFGNEGTGVSCAYNYPWKTGNTYRIEVSAVAFSSSLIDVSAYLIDLANNARVFLGTLRQAGKPVFQSVYSFVEDIAPEEPDCMSINERRALFGNTSYLSDGKWLTANRTGLVTPYDPTLYCATRGYDIRSNGIELGVGGKTRAITMSKSITVTY